nr:MAG TPA: hypothetical protein [Inoviridae sp.]
MQRCKSLYSRNTRHVKITRNYTPRGRRGRLLVLFGVSVPNRQAECPSLCCVIRSA